MIQLSAVVITFNEEVNIERCLKSLLPVADEIVVVDSFSTDATEAICKKYNVRFIQNPFGGHIEQKNFALDQAKFPYVLSLDTDEALDETLTQSILEVKNNWQGEAYTMNRLTNYCGTWIKHGSWYPDTKLRLALRSAVYWGGENPHDRLISNLAPSHLKGDLLHYSYYTVEQHYMQQEKFSTIAAKAMYSRGKKAPWYKLVLNPVASVIKDIIIRSGYLDGAAGWRVAYISAKSVYWKYYKLRQLWKGKAI
jgi:glycosyltransferase involved in cell wall biosynthesis